MIALPALNRSCCCCCRGAGGRLRSGSVAGGGVGFAGAIAAVGGESAAAAQGEAGPLGWQRRPRAGVQYRVPPVLYERLKRAEEEPVFVQSRCGQARDCIPDDRILPNFRGAVFSAYAWVRLASGRFVDIFSEPGRRLLAHIAGSSADYVEFLSTSRDEQEMQLIQISPNAGRYGFLPP